LRSVHHALPGMPVDSPWRPREVKMVAPRPSLGGAERAWDVISGDGYVRPRMLTVGKAMTTVLRKVSIAMKICNSSASFWDSDGKKVEERGVNLEDLSLGVGCARVVGDVMHRSRLSK
jgi:hypothetical protein